MANESIWSRALAGTMALTDRVPMGSGAGAGGYRTASDIKTFLGLYFGYQYSVDYSQADQGAASGGTNLTIYDVNATVGASKYALIKFSHNPSNGNSTAYTIDTDLDLSARPYIYYCFEPGAYIDQVTGDETFTIYSPENIIAQRRQKIFDGNVFAAKFAGTVYPNWWGAVGDNSTDNYYPIYYALNMQYDDTFIIGDGASRVHFPSGIYQHSIELQIPNYGNIIISGDSPRTTRLNYSGAGNPTVACVYLEPGTYMHRVALIDIAIDAATKTNAVKLGGINEYCEISNVEIRDYSGIGLEITGNVGAPYSTNSAHFSARNVRLIGEATTGATKGLYLNGAYRTTWINLTVDTASTAVAGHAIGIDVNGSQNLFLSTQVEDCGIPINLGGGTHDTEGNVFITTSLDNVHTAKVSDTFDGITGTFGVTVQSDVKSYSFLGFRDYPAPYNPADVLIRDAYRSRSITQSANSGYYQKIEAMSDGSMFVDGDFRGGRFSPGQTSISADNDNLDVAGVNSVLVDTASGNVTLGGLQGGKAGQYLSIIKTGIANDLIVEHLEGVGTQDIVTYDGNDATISTYGGMLLWNNGSNWYEIKR